MVTRGIKATLSKEYTLAGVYDKNISAATALSEDCGCECCQTLVELLALSADYVIEAATPATLKEIVFPVLESGSELIVLSVGAFADSEFFKAAENVAERTKRKIHIVSGAIGGFDIMQAAMMSGILTATIKNFKPPEALEGAPALGGRTLSRDNEELIFSGNAIEAIKAFPQNVNVAVALSIATVGPENTKVEVTSVPQKELNTHRIELEGDFGEAVIEISSKPSPENPKSSAIAAISVLSKLKNLASFISY